MLSQFLISELFAFFLIFCRAGAALFLLPGFGESYISVRIRLLLALTITLVLTPVLTEFIPPIPAQPSGLALIIGLELLIGIFLGAFARILISAMQVASTTIAFQSGLASAITADIMNTGQGTAISNLLATGALVMAFTLNLHHLMLAGIHDSYLLFAPGETIMIEDMAMHLARTMSDAFNMALKIAAPHVVIGLLLYLGAGVLARLMPQMQIFFVMLPVQMYISYWLLLATMSGMFLWYMNYLEDGLATFVQ